MGENLLIGIECEPISTSKQALNDHLERAIPFVERLHAGWVSSRLHAGKAPCFCGYIGQSRADGA